MALVGLCLTGLVADEVVTKTAGAQMPRQ